MATTSTKKADMFISVVSLSPNSYFWRGGRAWMRGPQIVPVTQFTDEQLAAIRAEPLLQVTDVASPEDGNAAAPDAQAVAAVPAAATTAPAPAAPKASAS